MKLGSPAPAWEWPIALGPEAMFFRVREQDVFSPQDTDGDGIDDLYELLHPGCLDPLNYADASQVCLADNMSNYQYYLRDLFGGPGAALQFHSREATVFNFGDPTATWEAMSKEVSLYNALPGSGPPASDILQVHSREVTAWNFGAPSARIEAISREATVWNFGSPSVNREAISKEVSVYNASPGSGPPMTELLQVHSREVSAYNLDSPTARIEAISREVSVMNYTETP